MRPLSLFCLFLHVCKARGERDVAGEGTDVVVARRSAARVLQVVAVVLHRLDACSAWRKVDPHQLEANGMLFTGDTHMRYERNDHEL